MRFVELSEEKFMNYKFVKISSPYKNYLEYFYKKHTNIPEDYNDHLTSILNDSFSYGNAWSKYLTNLGNETHERVLLVLPIHRNNILSFH